MMIYMSVGRYEMLQYDALFLHIFHYGCALLRIESATVDNYSLIGFIAYNETVFLKGIANKSLYLQTHIGR